MIDKINNRSAFILIAVVAFAVYVVLCLLIAPFGASLWCAIVFALLQGLLLVYAALCKKAQNAKNLFIAYPRIYVSFVCACIQAIFGLVAALFLKNITIAIAVGIILLAVSAIALLATSKSIEYIEELEVDVNQSTEFIKTLILNLEALRLRVEDEELVEGINAAIDAARFSDPVSTDLTIDVEAQIAQVVGKATKTPTIENLHQLHILIEERAKRCKAGK